MLRAYGDESMDETRQRVTAVAACVGTEDAWAALEKKWVARNNGVTFHAADCDVNPGRGDYAERSCEENKALYRDLVVMLAESDISGIGIAIDMAAQRKVFPDAMNFTYYRAFLQIMEMIKSYALSRAEIAELTFDARTESDHNAALLYAHFRADTPGWKEHLASKISFDTDDRNVRIQVADLMARETMKGLDNKVGPVKRKERLSWIALANTGRFAIWAYSDEFFDFLNQHVHEANKALGFTRDDYLEWLRKRKRQHNETNVFEFLDEKTRGRGEEFLRFFNEKE